MSRFRWPLERLLSVTTHRENARRAELLNISRQIARLRQECLTREATLRAAVADLSGADVPQRLGCLEIVLRCWDGQKRQIDRRMKQIAELAARREAETTELARIRRRRETLERLRHEARTAWARQQVRLEQKQFDESAHVARARAMALSAAAGAGADP